MSLADIRDKVVGAIVGGVVASGTNTVSLVTAACDVVTGDDSPKEALNAHAERQQKVFDAGYKYGKENAGTIIQLASLALGVDGAIDRHSS